MAQQLKRAFYCIGAQKAGTTWLHSVMSQDTRLRFQPFGVKEIHYFDYVHGGLPLLNAWRAGHFLKLVRGGLDRDDLALHLARTRPKDAPDKKRVALLRELDLLLARADDGWYQRLLKAGPGHAYSVDITPDYAVIGVDGFRHMMKVAVESKFLFILRNPVERAWSAVLQSAKNKPNGQALLDKLAGRDVEQMFQKCTVNSHISRRNDYLETLESLERAGALPHTRVAFYDELGAQPAAFIERVYQHLGLPLPPAGTIEPLLNKRVHVSPKVAMPDALRERLAAHYRPMLGQIAARYAPVPAAWIP